MSPEELKACGRRIVEELFNQGDLAVVDELIDPDFHEYVVADRQAVSSVELKDYVSTVRRAFPDLRSHIEEQVAEGDLLVQRLTVTGTHDGEPFHGLPATGRQIQIGLAEISQMGPNGRFVRRWTLHDALGLLRQLGATSHQAEGFPTAPQGNVTQTSHKHVTKQNLPSPNATTTLNSGEADQ